MPACATALRRARWRPRGNTRAACAACIRLYIPAPRRTNAGAAARPCARGPAARPVLGASNQSEVWAGAHYILSVTGITLTPLELASEREGIAPQGRRERRSRRGLLGTWSHTTLRAL